MQQIFSYAHILYVPQTEKCATDEDNGKFHYDEANYHDTVLDTFGPKHVLPSKWQRTDIKIFSGPAKKGANKRQGKTLGLQGQLVTIK